MAKTYRPQTAQEMQEIQAREEQSQLRTKRKSTLKSFQRRYPGQELEWQEGKLLFSATKLQVPDSPVIEKKKPETARLVSYPRFSKSIASWSY